MSSTAAAPPVAAPDAFTRVQLRDGPTMKATGGAPLSTPPSAASWSPHNVLCIALSTQLQFFIRDCQRALRTWTPVPDLGSGHAAASPSASARNTGLRQVAWAPGLRREAHYPAACWIAVLTDVGLHAAVVHRHGDRVELTARHTSIVVPREKATGRSEPPSPAWIRQVEWLDAETLLILMSTRVFLLHLPAWEAATATVVAADEMGGGRRKRGRARRRSRGNDGSSPSDDTSDTSTRSSSDSSDSSSSSDASSASDGDDNDDAFALWGFSRVVAPALQFTESFQAVVACRAPDAGNATAHHPTSTVDDKQNAIVLLTEGTCYFYQQQQARQQPDGPMMPLQLQYLVACPLPCAFQGVSINAAAGHRIPPMPMPAASKLQGTSSGASRDSNRALSGQHTTLPPANSVLTLCLVVCYPATVAHFTFHLDPRATTAADGIRLLRALYWPSEALDNNVGWLSVLALAAIPGAFGQHDASQLATPTTFRCAYLLVGCRSLLGIVADVVLNDGAMLSLRHAPAHTPLERGPDMDTTVLWKCPRVHGIHHPHKVSAVQLIAVAVHSSYHVVGILLRIYDDSTGMHAQLIVQSMRDRDVCPIARFCDALNLWKHYGHCLTAYPRDSYAAREYVLADTGSIRSLAYYHERRSLLMLLGAGAPVKLLYAAAAHVPRSFVDEAQRSMQALLSRYTNNRAKYGPDLVLKQGWYDNSRAHSSGGNSFHWRNALVAVLRTFELPSAALELVVGSALLGLHGWWRWSQRNFAGGLRPPTLPSAFSCANATQFLEAYIEALSSDRLNQQQQRVWNIDSTAAHDQAAAGWGGSDGLAFPSAILRGNKEKEAGQFADQLRTFLANIAGERVRLGRMPHASDGSFWPPASANRCSVCLEPLPSGRSVPLTLLLDITECAPSPRAVVGDTSAAVPESHTTVFSPITFEPLGLYNSDQLIAKCSCCSFFQEVQGATCVLCDAILK